jgi:D-alanyl-D-alanine carboxypeptidase
MLYDMRTHTRTIAVALIAALTVGAAVAPASASAARHCPVRPSAGARLPVAELEAAIAGLPDTEASGALVQVRGTAGCWWGSSGITDVRTGRPPVVDGRFRIGLMTKTFTAIVTLQLAAEGRLALDGSVQQYAPGLLPASYPRITVRQLLTWTSGINGTAIDSKDPDWFFAHRYDRFAPGSQLDLTQPPAFPPGSQQRYGNADYIVAGLVIEKVTGHSWADEVTRRILRPLRLTGTSVPGNDPRIAGPHAHGYEATAAGWVDVTRADPSLQWSAASIISTAGDLDRLMVALFSGRLVPRPQLEAMFTVPDVELYGTDQPAVYSAGLTRFEYGGVTVWAKSGDRPGYNNGMGATRDLSRRLVYSVNTLHMGGDEQPQVAQRIVMAALS